MADVLLVDCDPITNIQLIRDPGTHFLVIMKDGKIYKNTMESPLVSRFTESWEELNPAIVPTP